MADQSRATRRSFIKGSAVAGAGALALAGVPAMAQTDESGAMVFDREADILVVGLGLGGLTAALRSIELGAGSVIAVEKDTTGDWIGGNFILSGQFLHISTVSPEADPETLREAITNATKGSADLETTQVLIDNGARAMEWLRVKGVEFNPEARIAMQVAPAKTGLTPYWWMKQKPGGELDYRQFGAFQMSKMMEQSILDGGGEILYGRTMLKLIVDDAYEVVGAVVRDEEGNYERIGAKAVILCTGGFQANRELMARYFGPKGELIVATGTPYNKGQGYLAALEVGAAATNLTSFYASLEVEKAATDPDYIMSFSFPYQAAENGVLVDEYGNRFVDESGTRHMMAHYLIKQPLHNPRGLVIFDSAIYETPGLKDILDEMIEAESGVMVADTLEELAEMSGFSKRLVDTVEEYNLAVEEGRADRLAVPKVAKANALTTAPFYGIIVRAGTPYTEGGVRVTTKGEVIDLDGLPIPGLYAAGDIMAGQLAGTLETNAGSYVGGLATALIFGLVTAEAVAETLGAE